MGKQFYVTYKLTFYALVAVGIYECISFSILRFRRNVVKRVQTEIIGVHV